MRGQSRPLQIAVVLLSSLSLLIAVLAGMMTVIAVGLIVQERQGTTLICRANYDVMRGIVAFLVAECCTETACGTAAASVKAA